MTIYLSLGKYQILLFPHPYICATVNQHFTNAYKKELTTLSKNNRQKNLSVPALKWWFWRDCKFCKPEPLLLTLIALTLCIRETGTLQTVKSEDQDEMLHYAAHQGLHCLLNQKRSSDKKYTIFFKNTRYSRTSMAWTLIGWLELSSQSLQVILCILHLGWLKLPLARTIFHGPKPVWAIEVLLYVQWTTWLYLMFIVSNKKEDSISIQ